MIVTKQLHPDYWTFCLHPLLQTPLLAFFTQHIISCSSTAPINHSSLHSAILLLENKTWFLQKKVEL